MDAYNGSLVTKCALRLAPLVFVRPGELRQAEWAEFDLDGAQWNIPAEKMKMREPHLVPLAPQAVAILRELHPLTGRGRYVFPSARSPQRPMSNNAVLSALRRMDYATDEMSGHGFRAMARTAERSAALPARLHRAPAGACGEGPKRPRVQSHRESAGTPQDDGGMGGLPGRTARRWQGGGDQSSSGISGCSTRSD